MSQQGLLSRLWDSMTQHGTAWHDIVGCVCLDMAEHGTVQPAVKGVPKYGTARLSMTRHGLLSRLWLSIA